MNYFADRLKERSTWLGLLTVGSTMFGVNVDNEVAQAVLVLGPMASGALGVLLADSKKEPRL